jgi:DNA invertase Pin-like site-specific DNA recombinase
MLRAGLYARVSTNDQQTLAMQNRAMREHAARRGWTIWSRQSRVMTHRKKGSGSRTESRSVSN